MKRLCKGKYVEYVDGKYVNKEFENGIFHQFGVNYEELSCGVGHWTTAIVELEDGKIVTPAADMIQFTGTIHRMKDRMVDYLCPMSWNC